MGMGDWLMATGEVKAMYEKTRQPVLVVDHTDRPQWSEIFRDNPKIIKRARSGCGRVLSSSGRRPYIESKTQLRWNWRQYKPIPGELYFSSQEIEFAKQFAGAIMIEPQVKNIGHSNKAWFRDRWQSLVDRQAGRMVVQCSSNKDDFLTGVIPVVTPTFRHACAVLAVCKAFVGTEGGLMHAAAATNVPAIILWSEYIAPSITGYSSHVNLRYANKMCGLRLDCPGCRESMNKITVNEVAEKLEAILKEPTP